MDGSTGAYFGVVVGAKAVGAGACVGPCLDAGASARVCTDAS